MAVLPSGLTVPPLPYLGALVVSAATMAAFLLSVRPRFDQTAVAALTPWMAVGATAHGLYQVDVADDFVQFYPDLVDPLVAAPAVYLSTFVVTTTVWSALVFVDTLGGGTGEQVPKYLGVAGGLALAALIGYAAYAGMFANATPFWPTMALVASVPAAVVIYFGLTYWATGIVSRARLVGGLVVFAHLLDGITTAVGVDFLPDGELDAVTVGEIGIERSPIPRTIMEFAADLPTGPYMGAGWLFIVVKLLVAIAIVALFADYLEDEPVRGNLLFAVVVVFGLGPAINNLVVFALQGAGTAG